MWLVNIASATLSSYNNNDKNININSLTYLYTIMKPKYHESRLKGATVEGTWIN